MSSSKPTESNSLGFFEKKLFLFFIKKKKSYEERERKLTLRGDKKPKGEKKTKACSRIPQKKKKKPQKKKFSISIQMHKKQNIRKKIACSTVSVKLFSTNSVLPTTCSHLSKLLHRPIKDTKGKRNSVKQSLRTLFCFFLYCFFFCAFWFFFSTIENAIRCEFLF